MFAKALLIFLLAGLTFSPQSQTIRNKKDGFLVGKWLLCKQSDGDNPGHEINTKFCPSLIFSANHTGSIREGNSALSPFTWRLKKGVLTVSYPRKGKVVNDFIVVSKYVVLEMHRNFYDGVIIYGMKNGVEYSLENY